MKIPFERIKEDIYQYGLFLANNKIWMAVESDGRYFFNRVSNFSIEIIQHMQDEKYPLKLLRIKNIHGLEKIFDVPSEQLNTPQQFDNAVTAHGNFLWTGGRAEFQKLRAYLFDRMGNGRKIDVLGWQPEGFWAWNNKITVPESGEISMDENGIVKYKNASYYIPSANKIYANNHFKYDAQKKAMVLQAGVSFQHYTSKMIEVHRNHSITGILFSLASIFQDIVVDRLGNFPLLFLYGPASSGKDQLAECCQSFFGRPQTAINLESGVSTIKAQVREFAQFSNFISHLSEYKRGDSKLDGVLKGLWDRRSYKRGNIDSHVGTESIPILSSVIMTGNDYPDAEALITRLIPEEMTKTQFSDEEVRKFEELRDMTKNGISSFTEDILQYRSLFAERFLNSFRMFKDNFNERIPDAKSRMISNMSVLSAVYDILKDKLAFPFDFNTMIGQFDKVADMQIRKLNSASIINRWWDCFLASMRGHRDDRLQIKRDYKLEGERLYFNFTNTYNKIQRQWWTQYHEAAPGKTNLQEYIKKDGSFIEYVNRVRMDEGRKAVNTSAYVVNVSSLNISEELQHAVEWQINEGSLFPVSPATPKEKNEEDSLGISF